MKPLILPLTLAALLAGPALAEPDTRLPRLMLPYVSAFAGLTPHADPPAIAWSDSNARVGALQGHAGHWRQPPAAAPSTAPSEPPSPATAAPPPREGVRP